MGAGTFPGPSFDPCETDTQPGQNPIPSEGEGFPRPVSVRQSERAIGTVGFVSEFGHSPDRLVRVVLPEENHRSRISVSEHTFGEGFSSFAHFDFSVVRDDPPLDGPAV